MSPGRCVSRCARSTRLEQLVRARSRAARRPTPAARSGTITFSSAVSDGTRLNAWNTTPTVERRYSVSAAPRSWVTSMSATRTEPDVGVRIAASTESNVVLPQPRRAEQQHELAARGVEVEPVDRPDGIAAGRVLDDEIADVEVGGHAYPPNASAGSTVTARRRPNKLESSPTTIATIGNATYAELGDLDPHRHDRREQPRITSAAIAAATASSTAWNAMPKSNVRFVTPVALNTAKSRVRSSAWR